MSILLVEIITELQAMAQNGLTFAQDRFDIERYTRLMAISAELASLYSNKTTTEISEIFYEDLGYITPKIAVRAAIFVDDKILLIKERADNLWSLPGGWAEVNLSLQQNVIKEVYEETGLEAAVDKLMFICDKRKANMNSRWPHIYEAYFLCHITGGALQQNTLETSDASFFTEDHIPPLSLRRVNYTQITDCFKHHRTPNLPTTTN